MIKIALRRNLIYPFLLLVWKVVRDAESYLILKLFNFNNSLIYTPIMFLGEFFAGLILFKYEKKFASKRKEKKNNIAYPVQCAKKNLNLNPVDGKTKIHFLIFAAAFSDFTQFMIRNRIISKFMKISSTLQNRLGANITFIGALFYVYAFKIKIYKHHIFTFIVISACLVLVIIFEYVFQEINIFLSYTEFTIVLLIILVNNLFENLLDTLEKYLFEYDFCEPLKVLMFEGIYGFLLSFSLLYFPEFTTDLIRIYNDNSVGYFILFIFLLVVYFILCGGKNAYRVITTKLYSPMTRVFTDYFLNPFYLIYYFAADNDFKTDSVIKTGFYFGINLIISIANSFVGLVFNEFLVLFMCGLERDTHDQVSRRAETKYEITLNEKHDDNEDDDSDYKIY